MCLTSDLWTSAVPTVIVPAEHRLGDPLAGSPQVLLVGEREDMSHEHPVAVDKLHEEAQKGQTKHQPPVDVSAVLPEGKEGY
ncbi:hypothetical protein EYF80_012068 [Liparis tanakae]|uniref:Uncharacterized protein n=1 Tax=Liparis tanakae TaxID=230148 RepID=A0A4Z2IIF9_9TELE|nr:hypothetical protein EYF80_012068 [Liparis tanakae]